MTREEQEMFKSMNETIAVLRASLFAQAAQMRAQSQRISVLLEQTRQQAERIEELLHKIDEGVSRKACCFP